MGYAGRAAIGSRRDPPVDAARSTLPANRSGNQKLAHVFPDFEYKVEARNSPRKSTHCLAIVSKTIVRPEKVR